MDPVQEALLKILSRYGYQLCEDPRRLRSLLRDLCGRWKLKVNLLLAGLDEGLPSELLACPQDGLHRTMLRERLQKRLQEHRGLAAEKARWTVETWSEVLGSTTADGRTISLPCPKCGGSVKARGCDIGGVITCTPCRRRVRIVAEGMAAVLEPDVVSHQPEVSQELTVSADGTADHCRLRDALTAARPGARVIVRPGRYSESLTVNRAVEIVGDGSPEDIVLDVLAGPCILVETDGVQIHNITLAVTGNGPVRRRPTVEVIRGHLQMSNCRVTSGGTECLNVHGTTGSATVRNSTMAAERSNGVAVWDGASVILENCGITGSRSSGVTVQNATFELRSSIVHGGRYYGVNAKASCITICDSEISENTDTGLVLNGCEFAVTNCLIRGNRGRGIWIYGGGKGLVEQCDLTSNERGGMYAAEDSSVETRGNKLVADLDRS